jgi:shikimate kinase / 3-dehydroquinate synthase
MRHLVLSGMMGTGKTTIGPLVAARLGMPFYDLDQVIEAASGKRIDELFESLGEAGFRALEAERACNLLEGAVPAVIAFGGGTVLRKPVRRTALARGLLVTLVATPEQLAERAGSTARPLLAGMDQAGRATRLATLISERAEAYAECHATVSSEGTSKATAEEVVSVYHRAPIVVPLGLRSCVVELCKDDVARAAHAIAALRPSSVIVVTDANVALHRAPYLNALREALGCPSLVVTLVPGEAHKTVSQLQTIWDAALGADIDRNAIVVGFGGGVALDMAGFAAATLLRGIRWVALPTSLLAMVDASVGGKTAVDHPSGKNRLGAFHQPSHVCVDLAHLETLPIREHRAGLAEAVKVGVIGELSLLEGMERDAELLGTGAGPVDVVVRQAITYKAKVVADDERESGVRALLNFGHTYGHALELAAEYTHMLHGEAVAIGMVGELRAAYAMGLLEVNLESRIRALLVRLGLPQEASPEFAALALAHLGADKKRDRDSIALPLPGARVGAHSDGMPGSGTVFRVAIADLRHHLNFGVLLKV